MAVMTQMKINSNDETRVIISGIVAQPGVNLFSDLKLDKDGPGLANLPISDEVLLLFLYHDIPFFSLSSTIIFYVLFYFFHFFKYF